MVVQGGKRSMKKMASNQTMQKIAKIGGKEIKKQFNNVLVDQMGPKNAKLLRKTGLTAGKLAMRMLK